MKNKLKNILGCILKYKLLEVIIIDIKDNNIVYLDNLKNKYTVSIDYFQEHMLPKLKIYATEDDDSLILLSIYLSL